MVLDEVHKIRRRGGFRNAGYEKPGNEESSRRFKKLSANERTRMLYEQHEMVLRDIESMKDDALRENDEKWQGIVADKDAEIARLRALLGE